MWLLSAVDHPVSPVRSPMLLRAASATTTNKKLPSTDATSRIAVLEADQFQPKDASIVISDPGWKALKNIDRTTFKQAKRDAARVTDVYFEDFSGTSLLPRPVRWFMKWGIRPTMKIFRTGILSDPTVGMPFAIH
jgi:hypothetical protein